VRPGSAPEFSDAPFGLRSGTVGTKRLRTWVVGFGTVGQWLVRAIDANERRLDGIYGVAFDVVAIANRRDGFVFSDEGLDMRAACDVASRGESLLELEHAAHWPTALEGMRATDADILVEVSASPATDGEPGVAHMREALQRRVAVVTSNKWPVALHGLELRRLADEARAAFRAESTVMSGTPVLGTLTEGLAGASPLALRGVLNATVNFILTRMGDGVAYEEALAEAQRNGLAERDPSDDVDGNDAAAKVMILAGLVFGRQLRRQDVVSRGASAVAESEVARARADGAWIREVASLELAGGAPDGDLSGRVEPVALGPGDPLASVAGTTNAIVCRVAPLGEVTIVGPGAGLELAGQGVFSDLIQVARRVSPSSAGS
jgi:homoserine dehydrogenase